ncbi:MAG: hypothetical protein ABIS67_06095 [Candidatus Eisenbacteria bacterium]
MKSMRVLAGCAFATLLALPALAATNLNVSLNLSNAPPPPVVVVQHAPRTVWLPESRVYVVNDPDFDDDYFQVGGFWYVYSDNYWYRARTWRGPFSVIEHRYVPHSVMVVPAHHWKRHPHGGPPGHMKKGATYVEHRGGRVERVKVKHKGKGKHDHH